MRFVRRVARSFLGGIVRRHMIEAMFRMCWMLLRVGLADLLTRLRVGTTIGLKK